MVFPIVASYLCGGQSLWEGTSLPFPVPARDRASPLTDFLLIFTVLVLLQLSLFQTIQLEVDSKTFRETLYSKKVNFEQFRRSKSAFNHLHLE